MKREAVIVVALFALIGKDFILFAIQWHSALFLYFSASAAAQDVEVDGTAGDVEIDLGASREASRTGTNC